MNRLSHLLVDIMLTIMLIGLAFAVWLGRQPQPDPTWERVQGSGVLRIGTDATYPPFSSLRDGTFVGYDIDLGVAVARRLGVRAEFVSIALDGQYDALLSGQVDLLVSALPFIYERQLEVRYSQPYYQAGPRLVLDAGERGISGLRDLGGRRVGVELGSNADLVARRLHKSEAATMILVSDYHSTAEALDDLLAGKLDAAIAEPLGLADYGRRDRLRVVDPPLADEPYVAVVKRDSPRLAGAVDATIAEMQTR